MSFWTKVLSKTYISAQPLIGSIVCCLLAASFVNCMQHTYSVLLHHFRHETWCFRPYRFQSSQAVISYNQRCVFAAGTHHIAGLSGGRIGFQQRGKGEDGIKGQRLGKRSWKKHFLRKGNDMENFAYSHQYILTASFSSINVFSCRE